MTYKTLTSIMTYGFSLLLMKGLSLIMLPIIARHLDVAQLGKLELIASIGAFLGILVSAAMHENLYRFVGSLKEKAERFTQASELVTLSLTVGLTVGSLMLIGLLLIPQSLWQHIPLTPVECALLILAIAFEGTVSLHFAWLRMNDRAQAFLAISVASTALQLCMILAVLHYSPSVVGILFAGTLTRYIQYVVLQWTNCFSVRKPRQIKHLMTYSLPLMCSALVAFGLSGAERWLIAYSADLNVLGYYAIAAKFALAMCLLVQPFGMWWMPKRFQILAAQGGETAVVHYTQMGITYILALAVFTCFAGQLFIDLALPEVYQPAQQLLVVTIAIGVFKEMTELFNLNMLYYKKTGVLFRLNLGITVGALLVAICVMHRGIEWLLGTLALAQAIRCAGVLIIGQRLQPLSYAHTKFGLLLLLTFGLLGLAWSTDDTHLRFTLCLLSPVCLIALALTTHYIHWPFRAIHFSMPRITPSVMPLFRPESDKKR